MDARKSRKNDPDYRKLRRALCVGYGNQLAERMLHHNGYHTVGYRTQLVQVYNHAILFCQMLIAMSVLPKKIRERNNPEQLLYS